MSKKLPNHYESEQSILGAIFLDPKKIIEVMDSLDPEDFFDYSNKLVYESMIEVFNNEFKIDYATVAARLEEKNELLKAGGFEYLKGLAEMMPSVGHLDTYIEIVMDRSLKRQLIALSSKIMEEGYVFEDSAGEYLTKAEERIFDLVQRRKTSPFINISEVLKEVKTKVETNFKRKGSITGLRTGFSNLDLVTTGLQPEELIILAARPSMGKSAFAINMAVNIANLNYEGKASVALFSLEMSNDQLASRILSSETNIDGYNLRTGKLGQEDWRKFEAGIRSISNLNIYFDDSASSTISDIRAKSRKLKQEGNLDFVVIDYLQLITSDSRSGNRQEEVAKISRGLKQMARELKVPVLALSQLSREVEKTEDKRPMLSHLRESGSIEQDADIVMFLFREDYYKKQDENKTGIVELHIAKNRQGESGKVLKYLFDTDYSRFKVLAEREE